MLALKIIRVLDSFRDRWPVGRRRARGKRFPFFRPCVYTIKDVYTSIPVCLRQSFAMNQIHLGWISGILQNNCGPILAVIDGIWAALGSSALRNNTPSTILVVNYSYRR